MMAVPDDAVVVLLLGRVKPEIELLFSPSADAAIGVDVRLQDPVVPLVMSKELDVDLVVVVREGLSIRHLQPII